MVQTEEATASAAGQILVSVFETLDRAGVSYCVLHGYDAYPQRVDSDVDCVIASDVTPARLYALLHDNKTLIGADVVRWSGYYFVLACRDANGRHHFVSLDFSTACELKGLLFYSGAEVLEGRRRCRQFWIPAAGVEFGCYVARSIAKGRLDPERTLRLARLYHEDTLRSRLQLARFWGAESTNFLVGAVGSGHWAPVEQRLPNLRSELSRRVRRRHPARFIVSKLRGAMDRLMRIRRPDGLNVVLLGPDGAGKSSVIDAVGPRLAPVFSRWECWGFAPALHRLVRPQGVTNHPHELPPRSLLVSVLRAAYWLAYNTIGYASLYWALARSTLVVHDRHFMDIFVDQKRYRYGGPMWLLRLIWRVMAKPDLIILLDAPPEVLQSRKQEVPFQETARQRAAYLALMRTVRNHYIVDAGQPFETVLGAANQIILDHLSTRLLSRTALERSLPMVPMTQLERE